LQALTGKKSSRYVFPLDRWAVEQSNDCTGLLLTLATGEGFQVCFGVPADARKGLGKVVAEGIERSESPEGQTDAGCLTALN